MTRVRQSTAIIFPLLKFHYTFQHLQMESRKAWDLPNLIYGKQVLEDIAARLDHIQNVPPNQRDVTTHSAPDDYPQLSQFGVIHLGSYRVRGSPGPIR